MVDKRNSTRRLQPQIDQVKKILFREAKIVRYYENVRYLKRYSKNFQEAQALYQRILDNRELEKEKIILMGRATEIMVMDCNDSYANLYGTSNFDIFSIYLHQYTSLLGIQEYLEGGKSYQYIVDNPQSIKDICKNKRDENIPKAVTLWRNKVAAHYAISDPRSDDNVATLMQSINIEPTYHTPYYEVGGVAITINNETSQLKKWSLTQVFDDLKKDHWGNSNLEILLYEDSNPG